MNKIYRVLLSAGFAVMNYKMYRVRLSAGFAVMN